MAKKVKTTPNVCIVESLDFMDEDARREGEIISRTLKMSGKRPHYIYIRSSEELEAFAKEYGESPYRYLHISCHGDIGTFFTTLDQISSLEMVDILAPHVDHRRVFVSACLATDSEFARALMKDGGCSSVVGPVDALGMGDAAIFWISFYHLMFKADRRSMKNVTIRKKLQTCADLIGESFRFFYWEKGKIIEEIIS